MEIQVFLFPTRHSGVVRLLCTVRFLLLSPRKKKQQMLSYFLRLSPEVTSWLYDKAKWSSLTKRNKGGRSAVGTALSEDADDAENEAVPPPRKVL